MTDSEGLYLRRDYDPLKMPGEPDTAPPDWHEQRLRGVHRSPPKIRLFVPSNSSHGWKRAVVHEKVCQS